MSSCRDMDGIFPKEASQTLLAAYLRGALIAVGAVTALMLPSMAADLYRYMKGKATGVTPQAGQEPLLPVGGTILPGPL